MKFEADAWPKHGAHVDVMFALQASDEEKVQRLMKAFPGVLTDEQEARKALEWCDLAVADVITWPAGGPRRHSTTMIRFPSDWARSCGGHG